jgi:putative DNA primase/helicase
MEPKEILTPDFIEQDRQLFKPETIKEHLINITIPAEAVAHREILNRLLEMVQEIDFRELAGVEDEDEKLTTGTLQILVVEEILRLAGVHSWGLCRFQAFTYIFNGAFWAAISENELETFLGEAAEKMGVYKFKARFYLFRDNLLKQFLTLANLPSPEPARDVVLINLRNGTFEFSLERTRLRGFDRADFLRYQLPFEHTPGAEAPRFKAYLERVLPDIARQKILAEYLGYIFILNSNLSLKLEKTLLLFGSGANGKSVFFDVVNAILGPENVSSYSLQSLTNESGYYRAKLGDKLLNYASEISGNLETAMFKQLVSGEPIEARLPYKEPFILEQYAKLIFNCNELPRDVEHTQAYFRRFIIIPFDVTIPEREQDKQLASKIIKEELSGVFNWVLEGLHRLLEQGNFTYSEAVEKQLSDFRKQSDSVQMFLDEFGYSRAANDSQLIKEIYSQYRIFCTDDGFRPVNKTHFIRRLGALGIIIERKGAGNVAFISKTENLPY